MAPNKRCVPCKWSRHPCDMDEVRSRDSSAACERCLRREEFSRTHPSKIRFNAASSCAVETTDSFEQYLADRVTSGEADRANRSFGRVPLNLPSGHQVTAQRATRGGLAQRPRRRGQSSPLSQQQPVELIQQVQRLSGAPRHEPCRSGPFYDQDSEYFEHGYRDAEEVAAEGEPEIDDATLLASLARWLRGYSDREAVHNQAQASEVSETFELPELPMNWPELIGDQELPELTETSAHQEAEAEVRLDIQDILSDIDRILSSINGLVETPAGQAAEVGSAICLSEPPPPRIGGSSRRQPTQTGIEASLFPDPRVQLAQLGETLQRFAIRNSRSPSPDLLRSRTRSRSPPREEEQERYRIRSTGRIRGRAAKSRTASPRMPRSSRTPSSQSTPSTTGSRYSLRDRNQIRRPKRG